MAGSNGARRRGAFAYALSSACLVLAAPGWAAALEVPVEGGSDTVTKTVETVLDPVRETAKPATETVKRATRPVREAAADVVKPVTDAVKPVTDTVDKVGKPVRDHVDEVVDPVADPPEPVDDTQTTDRAPSRNDIVAPPLGQRDRGPRATNGDRARRTRNVGAPNRRRRSIVESASPARGLAAEVAQPAPPPPVRAEPTAGSGLEQVRRAAVDASRTFRLPLLLAAAVLLFLGVQARIDGRDPKLAVPVVDEELTFA